MDIIVKTDAQELEYSNESILKGILHYTKFDGEFIGRNGMNYIIGGGKRAETVKQLGFSNNPTEAECLSKMKTFRLEAYPEFKFTVHKDLVNEVQSIYKDLKKLGVVLNKYQGSYCFRSIKNPNKPGSRVLSMHSFGCAIDLNYDKNVFVPNGRPLLDPKEDDTIGGVVRTLESPIVKTFAKYGWGWGGRYGDYMHFSKANGA